LLKNDKRAIDMPLRTRGAADFLHGLQKIAAETIAA
jgi:hypothetical protein